MTVRTLEQIRATTPTNNGAAQTMTYRQAVSEAKTLAQRSETDLWRLAELTWMEIRPQGKATQREWAKDVGLALSYVNNLASVWQRHRVLPANKRPRFADALVQAKGFESPADRRPVEAVRTIKAIEPEKRAAVVHQ